MIWEGKLNTRVDLARLVPEGGTWVELGVAAGVFARQVCEARPDVHYLGIDRWSDHHDVAEMRVARARLREFPRAVLCRTLFGEAARTMPEESCDAVYVDGYAHTGQLAGRTLDQWWGKVKRGGFLCGHDYDAQKWPHNVKSVNYFAGHRGLQVVVIPEAGGYASWMIRRPLVDRELVGRRSCVLVGNGPSLLGRGLGGEIDAHDEVVRFNSYRMLGFGVHVGTKTTLWSCYGRNAQEPRTQPPGRVVYLHGGLDAPRWYEPEEIWRVPVWFYDQVKAEVRAASRLPAERVEKLIPSAGLVTLLWLLQCHRAPRVSLAGFDHFNRAGVGCRHHYWLTGSFNVPQEHDGAAEAELVAGLVDEGRAVRLGQ